VNGLNWFWIGLMVVGPPIVAYPLARLIWRSGETILGNIAGTVVIFGSALGLIFREYSEIDRLTAACIQAGSMCLPTPSALARYALYATVGLVEVCGMFLWSLRIERQVRNRGVSPEWRT
jgi:hypothetical protein